MINSRKIEDLHPVVAEKAKKMVAECEKLGIKLLITSTYRDHESQNDLYAQGRTKPGLIVTKAKGGQSFHNFRVAFDVVPVVNGKADWNSKRWSEIGKIGKSIGLFWANDWIGFKELAHFQYTGKENNYSLALKHFQNGGTLEQLMK